MPGRAVDLLDRAKPHAFKVGPASCSAAECCQVLTCIPLRQAPKEPSCGRVQSFIQQNTRHVLVALVLLVS